MLTKKLPFPKDDIETLDAVELERRTCRALRLHAAWTNAQPQPHHLSEFKAAPVNALVDIKFLLRNGNQWLLTLSEGIWPVIECWDLTIDGGQPRRVGEWPCGGGRISNIVVDSDPMSLASLAISVVRNGYVTLQNPCWMANR